MVAAALFDVILAEYTESFIKSESGTETDTELTFFEIVCVLIVVSSKSQYQQEELDSTALINLSLAEVTLDDCTASFVVDEEDVITVVDLILPMVFSEVLFTVEVITNKSQNQHEVLDSDEGVTILGLKNKWQNQHEDVVAVSELNDGDDVDVFRGISVLEVNEGTSEAAVM